MGFQPGGLGAHLPPEKPYADKYPLTSAHAAAIAGNPGVVGFNWYTRFDSPTQDSNGRWWCAKPGDNLGSIRGGHCFCLKPRNRTDSITWWKFYDQGSEGACVGFGCSRMQTLYNRKRYDAFWLYHRAQQVDDFPGEDYEGTSVDAGLKVLKNEGDRRIADGVIAAGEGISAYRWTSSVDDVLKVLDMPLAYSLEAIPFLNSWGEFGYPHVTWMPVPVFQRLVSEDGDVAFATDR